MVGGGDRRLMLMNVAVQDFGLAAPVAKDVVGAVRKYSKTGVPQGVIR